MTSNGPLYALGGAHPNALGKSDAMSGLATGAKGNEREQDVHTPDCIVEVVKQAFGGRIVLDPCASSTRESFAQFNAYEADDGLSAEWPDGTYFNPPYKHLKMWLKHAALQTEQHIGLYPVRTNRVWWMDYHIDVVDAIAWLKPLAFAGHKQAFPAPLVLTYVGEQVERFANAVRLSGLAHAITPPLSRV